MEKRSLFKTFFGTKKQNKSQHTRLEMLNNYMPVFTPTNKYLDSSIVKSCINVIATHVSKFEIVHKQYKDDNIRVVNGDINFLLQHRPNPLNTPSQFLYKIAYNLLAYNNAFVYMARDEENMIKGFYPITSNNYELLEDANGTIYLRFNFLANNKSYEIPYSDLIHIRKMYSNNEIFGDNNDSLKSPVSASNTALQGIDNAIKSTAGLRGIIKFTNNILKRF